MSKLDHVDRRIGEIGRSSLALVTHDDSLFLYTPVCRIPRIFTRIDVLVRSSLVRAERHCLCRPAATNTIFVVCVIVRRYDNKNTKRYKTCLYLARVYFQIISVRNFTKRPQTTFRRSNYYAEPFGFNSINPVPNNNNNVFAERSFRSVCDGRHDDGAPRRTRRTRQAAAATVIPSCRGYAIFLLFTRAPRARLSRVCQNYCRRRRRRVPLVALLLFSIIR